MPFLGRVIACFFAGFLGCSLLGVFGLGCFEQGFQGISLGVVEWFASCRASGVSLFGVVEWFASCWSPGVRISGT